jgi:HD-GYP domain-containing protein (c-di-GMP phosphodiesterase class II)
MSATATAIEPVIVNPLATFVPVQVHALRTSRSKAVDLFVRFESDDEPRLYCRAGSFPDAQQFSELAEAGVEQLYVRSGDFARFSNGILETLDTILHEPLLAATQKFSALQLAVAVALEQTLRLVDCGRFHALAERISGDLVELLGHGDILPRELFRMARHDFTTFTHLTNVAGYCVVLAQEVGISNQDELRQIATAALLHDLGKRFVPPRILAHPGPLNDEERDILQSHPTRGYAEACARGNLEFGQLMMIYQHHERPDGTGYPVRVFADEIHPWARMLSIVNVFDTMTARRPGRRSTTPEYALDYQWQQAGTQFDGEYVRCWISAMKRT